jgi:hypothetical protein
MTGEVVVDVIGWIVSARLVEEREIMMRFFDEERSSRAEKVE